MATIISNNLDEIYPIFFLQFSANEDAQSTGVLHTDEHTGAENFSPSGETQQTSFHIQYLAAGRLQHALMTPQTL